MRVELVVGLVLLAGWTASFGQEGGVALQVPSANKDLGPPVPDADGNYRIGRGVSAPRPISMANPEFTEEARHLKISGNVLVGLTVDVEGRPEDVHVVKSVADTLGAKANKKTIHAAQSMDAKALEAVRQYRFKPSMLAGKAVPVVMQVEVNFQIF